MKETDINKWTTLFMCKMQFGYTIHVQHHRAPRCVFGYGFST